MSVNGLINNRLKKSRDSLKQVSNVAGYLVEDALLTIDSLGIDPTNETDFSLLSASTMVSEASRIGITDSEVFLNVTTARLRDEAHKIVGHSPDIISDIADAIVQPVKDVIDTALKPIQNAINGVVKGAQSAVDKGVKFIQSGFDNAAKTISTWVDDGFKAIGEGVNFVQSTVNSLLDGVANVFDMGILILQNSFKGLTDGLTNLLSFEIEDVLKLNESMNKSFEEQQTEKLKRQAGLG